MGWRTTATRRPVARIRAATQRAMGDFPQPVRTAETATTGTADGSIVRPGPSSVKSAPQASATVASSITRRWVTSLYANTTVSTRSRRQIASSARSSSIGMPTGYRGPAIDAG